MITTASRTTGAATRFAPPPPPRRRRGRRRHPRTRARDASRAGQVADASAWLGEGLEPICFDASPELRQCSPNETEMDRTDDGLVGRRQLLEGTALQHDLLPALGSPELGTEAELLVETNDLVDRLLLRDRRKRWRLADEVRAPYPSSLLGASAGVALRASEVSWRGSVQGGDSWRARVRRAARPRPRRGCAAGQGGCAPRVVPTRGLPRQGREGASGRCSSADRRAFQAHGRRGAPRPPARLRGSARGLGRSERGGVPCRVERLPGARSLSRSDRTHFVGVKMIRMVFTGRIKYPPEDRGGRQVGPCLFSQRLGGDSYGCE